MSQYWPWLLTAALIIVALGSCAGYLLWQLRRQRRAMTAAQQAQSAVTTVEPVASEDSDPFRLGAQESIRVLARCYLEGQVGGSEAALRIAVLLDQPVSSDEHRERGQIFTQVAAQLTEIPTHEDWKALPREQRDQHRATMTRLETEHRAAMEQAARHLLGEH